MKNHNLYDLAAVLTENEFKAFLYLSSFQNSRILDNYQIAKRLDISLDELYGIYESISTKLKVYSNLILSKEEMASMPSSL